MRKITLSLVLILALIIVPGVVLAEDSSVQMTAEELIKTAVDKTITLNSDVTLTTSLVINGNIDVLDLNYHTLTLKSTTDHQIIVNSEAEIKNGTLVRGYIKRSLLHVDGENANAIVNNVVFDGKEIKAEEIAYGELRAHAIYVTNKASLTVNDSTLKDNHTKGIYGGAFYADGANDIVFNNSTITNSYTTKGGAAIKVENTNSVKLQKTIISDCTIEGTGIVSIFKCNNFIFDKDSVVRNNKAKESAGINIETSNATISGTIEENETTANDGNGAGLYTKLDNINNVVTITDTAIIRNNIAGGAGAGIYVNADYESDTGLLIMEGGTVIGNTSKGTPAETTLKDGGGAGVYVARGRMKITDGIIKDNTSTSGVGNAVLVSNAGKNTDDGGQLEITGGIINGSIVLGTGNISISGGTYSTDVTEYLEAGLFCPFINDEYLVKSAEKHTINPEQAEGGEVTVDKKSAQYGETVKVTVTVADGYKLVALDCGDEGMGGNIMDVESTTEDYETSFIMLFDGEVTITPTFEKLPVIEEDKDKDKEEDENKDEDKEEDKQEEEKVVVEVIVPEAVEKSEELDEMLEESLQEIAKQNSNLADIIKNNDVEIKVDFDDTVVIPEEEKKTIEEAAKKEVADIKVAKYIDIVISVKNKVSKEHLTNLEEVTEAITFTVEIPKEIQEVKVAEGYIRKYFIVREHNGDIDVWEVEAKDGKLSFESDKFSTYAIAYKDVENKEEKEDVKDQVKEEPKDDTGNPATGDNIVLYVVTLVIAVAGMAAIVIVKKRNNAKK